MWLIYMSCKNEVGNNSSKRGNENGKILPRDMTPKKTIASIALFLAVILMIGMVGNTGVVQAEEEYVTEAGDQTAELRPEFSDVSYVIDDNILFKERFDDTFHEDWATPGDDWNVENSSAFLENESISIEEDDVTLSSDEPLYFETRLKVQTGVDFTITLSDGTNDVQLEIDDATDNAYGLDGTYGSEDIEIDEWTRIGLELDSEEQTATATFMHNNYTTIEKIEDDTWDTINTEDIEQLTIEEAADVESRVFYAYISEEGSPHSFDETTEVDSAEERWRPDSKDSMRAEISREEQPYVGGSGQNTTMEALGADTDELADMENQRLFDGNDSREFVFQTPENPEMEYDDRAIYYQGWSNTRRTIENNLRYHIAELHDVDYRRVELVDYYIEDMHAASQYETDVRDGIREAYADAIFQKAEEEEWEIWSETLDDEDDDGWRTVDELLMRDDFTKMEIQGHMRYGHPERLESWKEMYTIHTSNLRMIAGGGSLSTSPADIIEDAELRWYDPRTWFDGDVNAVKTDVSEGSFQVNTDVEVPDMGEHFADIGDSMRDMSVSQWGIHQETVDGMSEHWQEALGGVSSDYADITELQAKSFEATNSRLASLLEGTTDDLADALSFSQEGQHELASSLTEMQAQFTDEYTDMTENIFEFMSYDDQDSTFGKASTEPLTMSTANPTVTVTMIIIIVIVVLIVATVGTMWKKNNQTGGGGKTTRRS